MTKRERYNAKRRAASQQRIAARPVPYCNNPTCGKPLPKVPWGRKWCGDKCRPPRVCREEAKRARAMSRHKRFPAAKYIYAALDDAEPGMCPWGCEQKLAPREKTCCRREECKSAYNAAYAMGRRELARRVAPPVIPGTRPCACGCGETVTLIPKTRRYINRKHERKAWRARRNTLRLSIRAIVAKVRRSA